MSSGEFGVRSEQARLGPSDDRPLTEQEFQLLQRLLSDPFSFPIQFKTWLVSYLESSDLNLPMSAVNQLTSILGIAGVGGGTLGIFPAGVILPYGGDTAPVGAKMCDGGSYDRAGEARLFQAIGTRYGAVDAFHFSVPDIQGRMLIGKGTHANVNAVGLNEGLPVAQRRAQHRHTVNENPHTHLPGLAPALVGDSTGPRMSGVFQNLNQGVSNGAGTNGNSPTLAASTGLTVGISTSDPLDSTPYLTVNFIIIA